MGGDEGGDGGACGAGEEVREAEDEVGAARAMLVLARENEDVRMKEDKSREKTSGLAVNSSPTSLLPPILDVFASGGNTVDADMEMLNVFGRTRRGREVFSGRLLSWSIGLSNSADRRRGFNAEIGGVDAGDDGD